MPEQVLVELHEAHPGVNKIKGLVQGYVWGPNMDKVIEELIKRYNMCHSIHGNDPHKPGLSYTLSSQGHL